MRRISAGTPLAEPVAEFIHSSTWVDLQRVFNESLITGESTGLKTIAPLAGYEWPLHAPGGGLSTDSPSSGTLKPPPKAPDLAARTWLLTYNRGDVETTLAIREWLDTEGAAALPAVLT